MSRHFEERYVDQRSEEWKQARLGRLTGSVASDMLATVKSGEAAGRRNLRLRLVLERLTKRPQESDYVSPAMLAGIEREAMAFAAFEAVTGEIVLRSGFLAHTEYMAGASLDGHMGDFETLLSIKCRQPAAHYDFLKSGTIPGDALAQMTHELWITGAAEHRYFSWSPDFPEALQARIVTVSRADLDLKAYETKAKAFLSEVEREYEAVATMTSVGAQLKEAVA